MPYTIRVPAAMLLATLMILTDSHSAEATVSVPGGRPADW